MDHPTKPIPPEITPWTPHQMAEIAARAIGKVACDRNHRAATLLSIDEITAMTGMLIGFGLVIIPPGAPTPPNLFILPKGKPDV